mgnify:CR=1 FL=1
MGFMSETECVCYEWAALVRGAKVVTVELRSAKPALVHVSQRGPSNGAPSLVLTKDNRRVQFTNLGKRDTVYCKAKIKGTHAVITAMADKGQTP